MTLVRRRPPLARRLAIRIATRQRVERPQQTTPPTIPLSRPQQR